MSSKRKAQAAATVSLAEKSAAVADRLQAEGGEREQSAAERLRASVVRPLRARRGNVADATVGTETADAADELWRLALAVTNARVAEPHDALLAEATAALQQLALAFAESDAADRLAELQRLQTSLASQVQVAHNGPYLLTNANRLLDWLGQPLEARPTMALCRCGASQTKPFCDGSHIRSGFTDGKDPNRVPDRRDTYVGEQVMILDNRGICQHSGFCTDRLSTVFRLGEEPFVAPSGGRMDEIIRAIRDCPSGALSYAIDGVEARGQVDHADTRPAEVEVSKDGPYRLRGGLPLVDHAGREIRRNEGVSLEHYALCRCGHSQNKPFCSGMHWYVEFRDPVRDEERGPTIFEWVGGLPALTRMTRLFYEKHVPEDLLLAPLFADMSPDHPERVAKWLAEVFCGPRFYSEEYGGYPRMLSQHLGRAVTEQRRTRWVALLTQSALEAGLPDDPEFRSVFASYIEWGSRLAVENSQIGAKPPEHMPMPRWDWNTAAGPPGSRVSALAGNGQEEEAKFVQPKPGEALSFDAHIKPLFRERDRRSMQFAFDLWNETDVAEHADSILSRLRAGTMPCDGAWPPAQVELFEEWIAAGKPN